MSTTDPEGEDAITVLCVDLARFPIPAAEGAMRKTCSGCGTPVWLSQATAAALAGKVFALKCPDCIPEPGGDDEMMAPTDGQIEEIRRAIGPEGAAKARELAESPRFRSDALKEILRRSRLDRPRKPRRRKGKNGP